MTEIASLRRQAHQRRAADTAAGLIHRCPDGSPSTVLRCPWPRCGHDAVMGWSSCSVHFAAMHDVDEGPRVSDAQLIFDLRSEVADLRAKLALRVDDSV